jgi:TatA/E family protein of Tat protein translocase
MFLRNIGPLELIILIVIVALIFGGGRIADLGGALRRRTSEFRKEQVGQRAQGDRERRRRKCQAARIARLYKC